MESASSIGSEEGFLSERVSCKHNGQLVVSRMLGRQLAYSLLHSFAAN